MFHRIRIAPLAGLALLLAIVFSPSAQAVGELSAEAHKALRLFTRVLALIEDKYVEEVDVQDLIHDAISGMLAGLDPHSSFLTKEQFEEMSIDTRGKFGGLGIEISIRDGYIAVITPIDDTPAFHAGIQAGDLIVKIEGEVTKGMSLQDAVNRLRGEPGTEVSITVWREGVGKPFDVTIERAVIKIIATQHKILEPGYGYVKVRAFNANAAKGLVKSIKALKKDEGGLQGLIVDLRNNPGGLLDQAIELCDEFLDQGLIVYTSGRGKGQNISFNARAGGVYTEGPLVVLVNGGSASASEIVAGALKDRERAVILGTRTFGKGSIQTLLPMAGGAAIRLTTAKYFTPSGHDIQAKGIEPDFMVQADRFAGMDKDRVKFFRERDYKNRLKNVDELEEKGKRRDGASQVPEFGPEGDVIDKKPEERPDPQLEEALAILKAWKVFHRVSSL